MSDAELGEYPAFLRRVLSVILRRLGLSADNLPSVESGLDVTDLVETRVLDRVNGPILFAFEEVDRVLGRPWQKDFFAMLRLWHNKRWEDAWGQVDLALVIATEPYLLVDSADQSPFNVGEIVQLGPFSLAAVSELNEHYGAPLSASQCQELFELTHGQPYLTRVALYRLVVDTDTSWRTLQTTADSDEGPFADHLKALLMALHRAGLEEAMREVVKRGRVPGDDRLMYYKLRGAGLVTEENGAIVPANLLYARFFKKLLR
jgi:AAA-like domain